jgi:hypothetical protein
LKRWDCGVDVDSDISARDSSRTAMATPLRSRAIAVVAFDALHVRVVRIRVARYHRDGAEDVVTRKDLIVVEPATSIRRICIGAQRRWKLNWRRVRHELISHTASNRSSQQRRDHPRCLRLRARETNREPIAEHRCEALCTGAQLPERAHTERDELPVVSRAAGFVLDDLRGLRA